MRKATPTRTPCASPRRARRGRRRCDHLVGTPGNFLHENRETSPVSVSNNGRPVGEGQSRTANTHAGVRFFCCRRNNEFHRPQRGVTSCPPVLACRGLREDIFRRRIREASDASASLFRGRRALTQTESSATVSRRSRWRRCRATRCAHMDVWSHDSLTLGLDSLKRSQPRLVTAEHNTPADGRLRMPASILDIYLSWMSPTLSKAPFAARVACVAPSL